MTTMASVTRRNYGGGSPYRRKDGRYVYQTERQGVRTYGYGATPSAAREDNFRKQQTTGRSSSPYPTESLAAFLAEWLVVMRPPKLGQRTHEGYQVIVAQAINPVLGDVPLARLGRQDVERAVSVWAESRHPRTVRHYLNCLKGALSKAVEWDRIAANPAVRIKTPRVPESRAAAFSERDEDRLLAYLRGEG